MKTVCTFKHPKVTTTSSYFVVSHIVDVTATTSLLHICPFTAAATQQLLVFFVRKCCSDIPHKIHSHSAYIK